MLKKSLEKVILVHIDLYENEDINEDLNEFEQLATSAGAHVVTIITGKRITPDPKYFAGSGKVEEIKQHIMVENANLVIFNHELTPAQERNLEKTLECRVLDRTGLILDIFAARARTFEGKLQVELAQLQHLSARLKRGWTHLERQRGGIGLRGPGETQLEEDRRVIKQKVSAIKKRLEKVRSQRQQGQRARKRVPIPTVALIGYTNTGKSTLFNQLTNAEVYVANQLFATLDPTLRAINIPGFGKIILADTVGFIRHLPHELIESFKATLEETKDADLLLHVIDVTDSQNKEKIIAVNDVLSQIGANEVLQLQVQNKIDLLGENAPKPRIDYDVKEQPFRVLISAAKGKGIDELLLAIQILLSQKMEEIEFSPLPQYASKIRANLYESGSILEENIDDNGYMKLRIRVRTGELEKIFKLR